MGNAAERAWQPSEGRRTETLDYVQAMLAQLCGMARGERCDMLAYLLEMAYLEASDIARGARPRHAAPPELASTLPHQQGDSAA